MKTFVIEGSKIKNMSTFYDEIEHSFLQNINFIMGRNLDAFDDILWGGYSFGESEKIKVIWKDMDKSRKALGYKETVNYLNHIIKGVASSNKAFFKTEIENAKAEKGYTMFDRIINIFNSHKHIDLILLN